MLKVVTFEFKNRFFSNPTGYNFETGQKSALQFEASVCLKVLVV